MAKAVKILCDELGIWCIVALSDANPDKGIKYRHAWNVIRIDGKYYHLDVTFDNTLSRDDAVRYDYVNLADKQIFRDHESVIWKVPECTDSDHFYYREKNYRGQLLMRCVTVQSRPLRRTGFYFSIGVEAI